MTTVVIQKVVREVVGIYTREESRRYDLSLGQ